MSTKHRSFPARDMRSALAAATFAVMTPLLAGCVSAVDETSAFGFSQTPPTDLASRDGGKSKSGEGTDSVAEAIAADAAGSADLTGTGSDDTGQQLKQAAASASASTIADDGPAAPKNDPQSELKTLASTSSNEGGIRPTALLSKVSNPTVSAYATPGGKQSDRSLYASLYNQSEAKTPLQNADAGKSRRVVVLQTQGTSASGTSDALPGVDAKSLFEIGQRASVDSELLDDIDNSYQLASLTGIARLAPSGLLIQRNDVVTNCFDSNLMALISQIESRFKQKVVITSGFRSPSHNRRVNGAKASMHMACKAADLHVPGVNGLEVARFVRALPSRGGVGTYCHTSAIHVDVGTRRDWNWPCRRRQAS